MAKEWFEFRLPLGVLVRGLSQFSILGLKHKDIRKDLDYLKSAVQERVRLLKQYFRTQSQTSMPHRYLR